MNEELQSTNEELETINDELRERTVELNRSTTSWRRSSPRWASVSRCSIPSSACRSGTGAPRTSGACARTRRSTTTSSAWTSGCRPSSSRRRCGPCWAATSERETPGAGGGQPARADDHVRGHRAAARRCCARGRRARARRDRADGEPAARRRPRGVRCLRNVITKRRRARARAGRGRAPARPQAAQRPSAPPRRRKRLRRAARAGCTSVRNGSTRPPRSATRRQWSCRSYTPSTSTSRPSATRAREGPNRLPPAGGGAQLGDVLLPALAQLDRPPAQRRGLGLQDVQARGVRGTPRAPPPVTSGARRAVRRARRRPPDEGSAASASAAAADGSTSAAGLAGTATGSPVSSQVPSSRRTSWPSRASSASAVEIVGRRAPTSSPISRCESTSGTAMPSRATRPQRSARCQNSASRRRSTRLSWEMACVTASRWARSDRRSTITALISGKRPSATVDRRSINPSRIERQRVPAQRHRQQLRRAFDVPGTNDVARARATRC